MELQPYKLIIHSHCVLYISNLKPKQIGTSHFKYSTNIQISLFFSNPIKLLVQAFNSSIKLSIINSFSN